MNLIKFENSSVMIFFDGEYDPDQKIIMDDIFTTIKLIDVEFSQSRRTMFIPREGIVILLSYFIKYLLTKHHLII